MSKGGDLTVQLSRSSGIKVNWSELSANVSDILIKGFAVAWSIDSAAGALGALVKAFASMKVERESGAKIWQLTWLSFGWSLDQIKSTILPDDEALKVCVRQVLAAVKSSVSEEYIEVPISFFSRPTTLPLYQIIRDNFVARKGDFRPSSNESDDDLKARFDSAFRRGVAEIWMKRVDAYQELHAMFEVPAIAASAFELQWEAYRSRLIYEFDVKPMFGQEDAKITLSHAYIPLRCRWQEKFRTSEGDEAQATKIAYLDELLDQWIEGENDDGGFVKLIGGGPGSGKSTTVRNLARRLADKPSVRPLYIPLQHIDLEGPLRESINNHFVNQTDSAFSSPPLARDAIEDGPRLVLIFDGLDEIARPGEGADEVANLFVTKLDQLQSSLSGGASHRLRVIVTGRLPSFQAAKRFQGAIGRNAVEVSGYAPIRFLAADDELAKVDQRPQWWLQYAPLAGLNESVPPALSDGRLADVTNEPLLCYLLVLSGFAVENWESAAENKNRMYQRLINEVWRRGWGDSSKKKDRQGPGKNLSEDEFNKLMETIALAAWLGGDTRVATESGFLSAIKTTASEDAWKSFCSDGGEDVTNLAMNFYLKASESTARGFEFTHKSFGDYLAARAIIAISLETSSLVPRHVDPALQAWLAATGTGVLTDDILDYIKDEFRLRISDGIWTLDVQKVMTSFTLLARTANDEGLPAHKDGGTSWRVASRRQKNAETMLWAILNASIRILNAHGLDMKIDVGFSENRTALRSMLSRLAFGEESNPPITRCLSYIVADKSNLFSLDLSTCDLSGSSLKRVNLNGSHLMNANLRGCSLEGARMQRANIDRVDLTGSNVDRLNLIDARIVNTNPLSGIIGRILISHRTFLDWIEDTIDEKERLRYQSLYEDTNNKRSWMERAELCNNLAEELAEIKDEDFTTLFDSDEIDDLDL